MINIYNFYIINHLIVYSTPMTTRDEITTTAPSPDATEATTRTGGSEATLLPPIITEFLTLTAVGLSGATCCCMVVFSLGCALTLTCRGCRKSRGKKGIQDSTFCSATLQRPLGDVIRDTFLVAIENPTFKDMSPDMEE